MLVKKFTKKYGTLNTMLLVAVLLVFVLRVLVVRAVIDGESMADTYHEGDNIWVVKDVGVGYSKGDVLVFDNPYGEEQDAWYNIEGVTDFTSTIRYIKRVVANGGDTVVVDGDFVSVNGDVVNEGHQGAIGLSGEPREILVGPGQYFVLGDNRYGSLDSRYFGVIESDSIVGKVYE